MVRFILGRLLQSVFVLFAATFIMYNLVAISGDPLEDLKTSSAPNKAELIESRTKLLHLDVIPPLRYFIWLSGVLHGDFGVSITNESVNTMLSQALSSTLQLVTVATVVAIFLGITVGIASALRQYSGFDYSVTFMSFLFFSLPVFWVAVLLKQYMAIEMNNWLADPVISVPVIVIASLIAGVLWMSIIGGNVKRKLVVFGAATLSSVLLLSVLSLTRWFNDPTITIFGVIALSVGAAYGVTALSTGLRNKRALRASLTVAALGGVLYFPLVYILFNFFTFWSFVGYLVLMVIAGGLIGWLYGGPDRWQSVRTAAIVGFVVAWFLAMEKFFSYWQAYSESSRIKGRPIATVGSSTPNLGGNFWVQGIDFYTHLLLPTIAIVLVSFAGYTRYSRASLLEVLNQDYIRTARAKGLTERTVVVRHAFRNALIPITTIIAFDIGSIVGGAVITETIFGWTGMGSMFVQALHAVDPNPVMAFFLVTGTLAVLFNLVADLAYAALDPRIRVTA